MYDNFPLINYPFDSKNNTKLTSNIMRNVKFTDQFTKNRGQLFSEYRIKDGDTPESMAHKIYGDPKLYWVLLIFNNIFNPYFQWPLNRGEIEGLIQSKYPGSCIFLNTSSDVLLDADGLTKLNPSNHWFVPGASATYYVNGSESFTCNITTTNRNLNCIVTETVSEVDLGGYLVSTSSSGVRFRISVSRIVYDNTYSLHHFEDSDGFTVDPYEGLIGNSSVVADYPLKQYINGSDLYSIPNRQYEENINDLKRKIYVLKPEYITMVNESLAKILNEQ